VIGKITSLHKQIKKYCKDHGIYKIYSPPYSPENNGLAERYNQTVISCTKTLLYWSGLSENFWDYAIIYANYLYNKTPHSSINNRVPDEIFFNRKAKINHIRVFGCLTFYKDYSPNKSKFSPEAKKGVFLGFSERSNSYLIMDYNDFKVHKVNEIYCLEDYPSNLKISNKNKTRFLGKKFLKFDFNFTRIEDIENEIDSIPNNQKMKHLRDHYFIQNKDEFLNNEENKYHFVNGTTFNNYDDKKVIIYNNENDEKNNNNSTTPNHHKNNFDNKISDENFSNNKNFQKSDENNEINENSNAQTVKIR